jgi:hypothetical protein
MELIRVSEIITPLEIAEAPDSSGFAGAAMVGCSRFSIFILTKLELQKTGFWESDLFYWFHIDVPHRSSRLERNHCSSSDQ